MRKENKELKGRLGTKERDVPPKHGKKASQAVDGLQRQVKSLEDEIKALQKVSLPYSMLDVRHLTFSEDPGKGQEKDSPGAIPIVVLFTLCDTQFLYSYKSRKLREMQQSWKMMQGTRQRIPHTFSAR